MLTLSVSILLTFVHYFIPTSMNIKLRQLNF